MNGSRHSSTTTLIYHDVVAAGHESDSGFGGADADRYKLESGLFAAHLAAIAQAGNGAPVTGHDLLADPGAAHGWSITFDDGGASARAIARELEARGWRGQFFVTTDRVGTEGFVGEDAIRALAAAGHVVGSHSHTHPQRMAACSTAELEREWELSVERLAAVLGERPEVAAIPGGWYSPQVAHAAAKAGIRLLYTSEPTRVLREVDGCLVAGRFAILHRTSARTAAGLASGRIGPRAGQRVRRMALAPVKRLSGGGYLRARAALLRLDDD